MVVGWCKASAMKHNNARCLFVCSAKTGEEGDNNGLRNVCVQKKEIKSTGFYSKRHLPAPLVSASLPHSITCHFPASNVVRESSFALYARLRAIKGQCYITGRKSPGQTLPHYPAFDVIPYLTNIWLISSLQFIANQPRRHNQYLLFWWCFPKTFSPLFFQQWLSYFANGRNILVSAFTFIVQR